ncbi:phosphotransferase [Lactiplantibacillus carotarum]|uniref:phosphotransferase n=1 Tax=Lactiplantibacillus carotarum TaxID=2993456 RepID=UPI00298F0AD8|nr:phosphotransferase [Lactiplantibacillus carotarum]
MDYFETKINQWSDWETVRHNPMIFEPLIKQIYSSENEPFKTPELVTDEGAAVFAVGTSQIVIFPPSNVAPDTRDRYQTERFSLTRMARLKLTAPELLHAGFIFDAYQFYYVIYRPLAGISLSDFTVTAEPLAKSTLARQIGTTLNQVNGEVGSFNTIDVQTTSNAVDWNRLGAGFATERSNYLAAHPVTPTDFVHGDLNAENLIVTSGQVGLQHFAGARRAPRQTELIPLIWDGFKFDADFLAGLKATLTSANLVEDVLLGLLWRADGPQYVENMMAGQSVTIASLRAQLSVKLNG